MSLNLSPLKLIGQCNKKKQPTHVPLQIPEWLTALQDGFCLSFKSRDCVEHSEVVLGSLMETKARPLVLVGHWLSLGEVC